MDNNSSGSRIGGVNITGSTVTTGGGDIVGGNKTTVISRVEIDRIFKPIADAVRGAPPDKQVAATEALDALKEEAAKGHQANDTRMAKLIDGLVGLAPGAVSAVVSTFATPVIGALIGPVTAFVLDKIHGK
jgi:hypothetical protein